MYPGHRDLYILSSSLTDQTHSRPQGLRFWDCVRKLSPFLAVMRKRALGSRLEHSENSVRSDCYPFEVHSWIKDKNFLKFRVQQNFGLFSHLK